MKKIILAKKKSTIEYVVNKEMNDKSDKDWFIDEVTKNGKKIENISTITKSDLQKRIDFNIQLGWIEVK